MDDTAPPVTDGRAESGVVTYARVMATPAPPAGTVLSSVGTQRFLFGEIWNRPGLTRKERRLVTLILVAESGDVQSMDEHVYGALCSGDLTLEEMEEVILHFAVYSGWPKAERFDGSVVSQWRRLQEENSLDLSALPVASEPDGPFDASKRDACGADAFVDVMTFDAPPSVTPYLENGVRGFVFGEVWRRPGISRKERRLLTLASVCAASAVTPIQSHVYAALNSGDISLDEIHEVGLHCAVYCGWPKASVFEVAVFEQWERIQSQGGPIR